MIEFSYTFKYENEKTPALKNVSGIVESGRCIVLCGGSGCGKSTLLRCIDHLIPQFYEGEMTGGCMIDGRDTGGLSIGEVGTLAASVFQDPRSQFFTMNSITEVGFGLENHGVPHDEIVERINKGFALFGLERLKGRSVYELSSGERQMISILSAWAMDTPIMLLDEPAANLDHGSIEQFRAILSGLKASGKTLMISEHKLYYLAEIADEYWVMENGEIIDKYTAEEMRRLSRQHYNGMPLRTLDLDSVCLSEKSECFAEKVKSGEPFVFSASDIYFSYKGKQGGVLKGLSFQAELGDVVGLVGPNGCGKTTTGKVIGGLLPCKNGSFSINGRALSRRELQQNVLFVMQEAEFQFFTNSVLNELCYGNHVTEAFSREAERMLKKFGMWEYRNRHPFSLSGGQMQRLSLLTAYFSPKKIAVLDETTAGLDLKSMKDCGEIIGEMRKKKLVFIITHDREFISQVCTKCLCIQDGKISREMILSDDNVFHGLVQYMESSRKPAESRPADALGGGDGRLSPFSKLIYFVAASAVVSVPDNGLTFSFFVVLILMVVSDGMYAAELAAGGLAAALFCLQRLFPHTAAAFALVFFPKLLAIGLSMYALIYKNEASRTIAAMRKIHIPERLIMICSVIFRFFPVLSEDMKIMRQAVRTRGAFVTLRQKMRSFFEYLEILTVPMALRVIRIAETLSASAETRGIDLKGGKNLLHIGEIQCI